MQGHVAVSVDAPACCRSKTLGFVLIQAGWRVIIYHWFTVLQLLLLRPSMHFASFGACSGTIEQS